MVLLLAVGCDDTPPVPPDPPGPRADAGSRHDPGSTGTLTGRVTWDGPRPVVPPLRSIEEPLTDKPPPPARDWANPNAPRIAADGGFAGVVVSLKGIDPTRGRPWDHPPLTVELRDQAFHLSNGQRVGFVRAGEKLTVVSRQPLYHAVQARGGGFFALTLPEPDQPRGRVLGTPGLVELQSGVGYFWMRAYVVVDHHPYHTLTDTQGRFTLADVPPGEYDLVAWHPSWRVARQERNSESVRVQQVRFEGPLSATCRVVVEPGKTTTADAALRR